jgi:uncharacterized protein YjbJ (UPF0337 family)
MNRDCVFGLWKQLRGAGKERWGRLTNDPGAVATGQRQRFEGWIQQQRGLAKQETDRQLAEFLHRNRDWRNPAATSAVRREFRPPPAG